MQTCLFELVSDVHDLIDVQQFKLDKLLDLLKMLMLKLL